MNRELSHGTRDFCERFKSEVVTVPATNAMGKIMVLAENTFELQETHFADLNFRAASATRAMFVMPEAHR